MASRLLSQGLHKLSAVFEPSHQRNDSMATCLACFKEAQEAILAYAGDTMLRCRVYDPLDRDSTLVVYKPCQTDTVSTVSS